MQLFADQKEAKSQLYSAINSGYKRVALQAPTAFGKTVWAGSVIGDILQKNKGAIFVVPMITLADQTFESFKSQGIRAGVLQQKHRETDISKSVQVVTIQSLNNFKKRRPERYADYIKDKILIIDECHVLHKAHKEIMGEFEIVIGLSATPWAKGLGEHFSHLVLGGTTSELIKNGRLSDYEAWGLSAPDLTRVGVSVSGDYNAGECGQKYDEDLVGDIVKTWMERAQGEKTILFAPRVVDAERFAAEFRGNGVKAVAVSGYMDSEDCKDEVAKYRSGETTVICSVTKLCMGFDVPDTVCMIDAQPTKSLMRHVQKMGRVLRIAEGKKKAIILDHAGNLARNGYPDSCYPTSLNISGETIDRRRQGKDDIEPKPCPSCGAKKTSKICGNCGFEVVKKSEVVVGQGELIKLGKDAKPSHGWDDGKKKDFWQGLLGHAKETGKKDGWAFYKFKEVCGEKPSQYSHLSAEQPKEWVKSYIKHLNIKAARSKAYAR